MWATATKEATHVVSKGSSLTTRRLLFLLLVISLMGLVSAAGEESVGQPQPRYKRTLVALCEFIGYYTGRGCLNYNDYGCYCGYGTSTATPVDAVDSCCRLHDRCYAGLLSRCWLRPHLILYTKQCRQGACTCTNSPSSSPCAYSTCTCDLSLAQCLRTATYNPQFRDWNRNLCLAS